MESVLGIDVNTRVNVTSKVLEELRWSQKELEIVNKLYKIDFERFSYSIRGQ